MIYFILLLRLNLKYHLFLNYMIHVEFIQIFYTQGLKILMKLIIFLFFYYLIFVFKIFENKKFTYC